MKKRSKNMTKKKNFYLSVINSLKETTNLSKIQKELNLNKQQLNYYLRKLQRDGYIFRKGMGWYELTEKSKNMTKYDKILSKDIIRGHAYVWRINLPKGIKDWDKRIEILDKFKFKYRLIGAKENTPSIKILGRKVWLCNDHLRVFDKPKASYYGENATESRKSAFYEILLIIGVLNNKLGINLHPTDISFQKEHYALIRNDLAIEHNRKREQIHISDEFGEWFLIDDSFGEGGELENIGKSAYQINIPMQKWWNDHKKTKFQLTPTFLMEQLDKTNESVNNLINLQKDVPKNMQLLAQQIKSHLALIQEYRKENIRWRKNTKEEFKKEVKYGKQTKLSNFFK